MSHHSLYKNVFGGENDDVMNSTAISVKVNNNNSKAEALQVDPVMAPQPKREKAHERLVRSIINPENPFAKMTDKDMLIFNPNYQAFLQKLKQKESKSSELSRIMSQPPSNKRAKKKEMALFAFVRATAKPTPIVELDRKQKLGGGFARDNNSQRQVGSRASLNVDLM